LKRKIKAKEREESIEKKKQEKKMINRKWTEINERKEYNKKKK
jgi:hypothetical protein